MKIVMKTALQILDTPVMRKWIWMIASKEPYKQNLINSSSLTSSSLLRKNKKLNRQRNRNMTMKIAVFPAKIPASKVCAEVSPNKSVKKCPFFSSWRRNWSKGRFRRTFWRPSSIGWCGTCPCSCFFGFCCSRETQNIDSQLFVCIVQNNCKKMFFVHLVLLMTVNIMYIYYI